MNNLKKIFLLLFLFSFLYLIFKYNYILEISVINSVNLWIKNVFPSLFIMFILNEIIIKSNILSGICNLIDKIFFKIYHTKSESFILSLFSGCPTNAFIIKEMLNMNKINENEANSLIAFTFFSNPLFLYNILSLSFNKYIVLKIILIHYLSNLIIGLFFRKDNIYKNIVHDNQKVNIIKIIPNAIKNSINTLLIILGTITFYMIISNYISIIVNLSATNNIILKGFLEITQSLTILNSLKKVSILKEIIAISIISFGGLSIHTQVYSLIENSNIRYKNFLIGRIIHVLVSVILYIITYII